MKLPAVSNLQYYWDGNSSTLRSYLRRWEVEFTYHSDNELIPFLKTLVPPEHLWRLKYCYTMEDVKEALLVLASSEDVYIENIIADIHSRPKCLDYSEDKQFLTFLSMKIAELIEIFPDYHMSPGQCCAFIS